MATFTLMTDKKTKKELERVPYIWYLVIFKDQTEALLDSKSKINTISQTFTFQQGLKIWKTNVEVSKIDNITFETYGTVVSIFFISDMDRKKKFFKESFLLADV